MGSISNPVGSITRNSLSGSISDPSGSITNNGFALANLFIGGYSGFLANPLVTYQDTGTTTISDDPGEAVGHILSQPGPVTPLDPTQATSSAKPVRAVAPFGGIRNQLIHSQSFDNAAWVKANSGSTTPVVTANQGTAPDGTLTADKIDFGEINAAGDFSNVAETRTLAAVAYVGSVYVKANAAGDEGKKVWAYFNNGGTFFAIASVVLTSAWQRITYTATPTAGSRTITLATLGSTFGGENQAAVSALVWGYQLEYGAAASAYQRVGEPSDITQSGVTSVPWIYGTTDDWMDFGAAGFGAETQGFYAAAGQNWTLIERFLGFTAGGFSVAQAGATAGDRMFTSGLGSTGTWDTRLRGTLNASVATYTDGVPHIISTVCTNGVVTRKIDSGARVTLTVGAAAAQAVNITMLARTASAPADFLTGRAIPEVIEDRALSEAEELQAMRLISSQIGGLVS